MNVNEYVSKKALLLFLVVLCVLPVTVLGQGGINTEPGPPQGSDRAIVGDTLPEFNYDGAPPFPTAEQTVGIFSYTIPVGEGIVDVTVAGQFGNTVVGSTAPVEIYVEGVLVATCLDTGLCYNEITPWSHTFDAADFALFDDGFAEMTVIQTGEYVTRLGETTLTITTAAVIPTLSGWVMALFVLALGALAFFTLRRMRTQA